MTTTLAYFGLPTPRVLASFAPEALDRIRRAASAEEASEAMAEAADSRDAELRRTRRIAFFAGVAINLAASAIIVFFVLREPDRQLLNTLLYALVAAALLVAPAIVILARAGLAPLAVARFALLALVFRAIELVLYAGGVLWLLYIGPRLPGMASAMTDNLAAFAGRAGRVVNNAIGGLADFLFGDDRTKSPSQLLWSKTVLGLIAIVILVLSSFLRGYAEEVGRRQARSGGSAG